MKAEERNGFVRRSWVGEAGSDPTDLAVGLWGSGPGLGSGEDTPREGMITCHLGDCEGGWCGKENSGTFQGLL